MAIQVTCPGCLKRFQVNDKFAGKTGPCPSCSKPIKIPDKSDEVVIHAPEGDGPKDSKGRPVFKPIRRQEVKLSLPVILAASLGTLICLGVALLVRFTNQETPTALLVLGSVLLAPPLVFAGYWFLHDDELEGYVGKELILRTALCSLAFMGTWGLYALIPSYLNGYSSLREIGGLDLVIIIPIMIILGTLTSLAAFELEFGQAAMHYLLYFAITLVLAVIMGAELASPLAREATSPKPPALPNSSSSGTTTSPNPGAKDGTKAPPPVVAPPAGETKRPPLMQ